MGCMICLVCICCIIPTFKFKRTVYFYKSPFLQHNKEGREFGIFWWWVPNNQTKEPVWEAESTRIHLRRAKQACWQGDTWGEGQQSTLWPCWRQWHNSNSCRVRASSFQSPSPTSVAELRLKLSKLQLNHKTKLGIHEGWTVYSERPIFILLKTQTTGEKSFWGEIRKKDMQMKTDVKTPFNKRFFPLTVRGKWHWLCEWLCVFSLQDQYSQIAIIC